MKQPKLLQFVVEIEDGPESQDKQTIHVPLTVPAGDVPNSVSAQMDPNRSNLLLRFDYSTSSERRVTHNLQNSVLVYGEKTGRIYEVQLLNLNKSSSASYLELDAFVQKKRSELVSAARPRMANNLKLGSSVLRQIDEKTAHFVNMAFSA